MAAEAGSGPDKAYDCDLCIVGAGYAALNGLNAAAKYLKKGDRVVSHRQERHLGRAVDTPVRFRPTAPALPDVHGGRSAMDARARPDAPRDPARDPRPPGQHPRHLRRSPRRHAALRPRVHAATAFATAAPRSPPSPISGGNGTAAKVRIRARRLLKGTGVDIDPAAPVPAFLAARSVRRRLGSRARDPRVHGERRSRLRHRQRKDRDGHASAIS